ncbi:MAG: translation initiation factor IF-2 [Chitinophagales bacterium]
MAKIRVHELARELNLPSKKLIEMITGLGIDVKNHMSTLEDQQAEWIKRRLNEPQETPKKAAVAKPEPRKAEKASDIPSSPNKPSQPVKGKPETNNQINTQTKSDISQKADRKDIPDRPRSKPEAGQDNRGPAPVRSSFGQPGQQQPRQGNRTQVPNRPFREDAGPSGPRQDNRTTPPHTPFRGASGPSGTQSRPDNRPTNQFRGPTGQPGRQPRPDNRPQAPGMPKREYGENKPAGQPANRPGVDNRPQTTVAPKKEYGENKPAGQQTNRPGPNHRDRPDSFQGPKPFKGRHGKKKSKKVETRREDVPEMITIGEKITVRDLAEKMNKSPAEIIRKLMLLGMTVSLNNDIDYDIAEMIAIDFKVRVEREKTAEELILEDIVDNPENMVSRPPVVTVMGHVDHGKTSLLDAIRETNVVSKEAGGITQHIGAYQVEINNQKITFIDTPGHEAFTAMRARGAQATDIAILVVAADDGVMPQTIEAINHAKAAMVPIIVAVNKIDKDNANPDRVKQQLTEYGLVAEEWGGDTVSVLVSAKSHQGIEHLLEMILLVAEMRELTADPERVAEGVIIEGQLDKARGPLATALVQKGTLKVGDSIICGTSFGKVRAMINDIGERVNEVGPSTPVEVLGLTEVPMAGDRLRVVDEKVARQVSQLRIDEKRREEQSKTTRVSLDDFFKQIKEGEVKELNLIVKGDVQGSVEAVTQSLLRLTTDEVKVNVIHSGVGAITENDVTLASASNAIIIGFNVRPDTKARKYGEEEKIDVRLYRVIYEAIDDVKKAMAGLLEPELVEVYQGRVEVRAIFKVPKIGTVAGCYVSEGKITRNSNIRVLRDGVVVFEGKLASLKRFKDDAKEVLENYECGMGIEGFGDIKEGDLIEAYIIEEVAREL